MSNVVTAPFRREHLGEMASKIEAVVYEYADRISLAEAIGILEIVKAQDMFHVMQVYEAVNLPVAIACDVRKYRIP